MQGVTQKRTVRSTKKLKKDFRNYARKGASLAAAKELANATSPIRASNQLVVRLMNPKALVWIGVGGK